MSAITPPEGDGGLRDRIAWDEITMAENDRGRRPASIDSLNEWCAVSKGRVTISGRNGSGKSTLLLLLKTLSGARAIYLPAQSSLCFESDGTPASTGPLSTRPEDTLPELSVSRVTEAQIRRMFVWMIRSLS